MGNGYLRISAIGEQSERRSPGQKVMSAFESFVARRAEILPEDTFHTMLTLVNLVKAKQPTASWRR